MASSQIHAWVTAPETLTGVLERTASIIAALSSEMNEEQIDNALAKAKRISKV